MAGFANISEYVTWLSAAPDGTRLAASAVCEQLRAFDEQATRVQKPTLTHGLGPRERFWLAPDEMRMNTKELVAGIGKPKSWIYRHTSIRSGLPQLPHYKEIGGELVFVVGQVREWLKAQGILVSAVDYQLALAPVRLTLSSHPTHSNGGTNGQAKNQTPRKSRTAR